MKRDTVKRLARLLFVLGIYLICFGSYFTVKSKEFNDFEEQKITIIHQKEKEKATSNLSILTSNSIQVAGTSRTLMKDQKGEHFYLNHNLQGDYDGIGIPYIDYRYDFTGRKTIIYAHSIKSGNGPFQILQNYHNNFSFYKEHPIITIHYENKTYTYQIFSVYVSTADSEESEGLEFFHRDYYTKKDWDKTLQKYKSYSQYDTGISVDANDKILILQTCSMDDQYFEKYYRYNLLVMGKLVS